MDAAAQPHSLVDKIRPRNVIRRCAIITIPRTLAQCFVIRWVMCGVFLRRENITDKVSQTFPSGNAIYYSFRIERLLYASLYKRLHCMESHDRVSLCSLALVGRHPLLEHNNSTELPILDGDMYSRLMRRFRMLYTASFHA